MITHLFRPTSTKRLLFFILFDILLSFVSLYSAYLLRFNFDIPVRFLHSFWVVYTVLVLLKVSIFYLFKNYFIVWRFFSFIDAKNIVLAHFISYGLFVAIYLLFPEPFSPFPRSVIIIDFFLSLILIGTLRVSKRFFSQRDQAADLKSTLIVGINNNTSAIIQSALHGEIPYYPVAIMATHDEKGLAHSYIQNIKVYPEEILEKLLKTKEIEAIIFTKTLSPEHLKSIVDIANQSGVTDIKQVKLLGNDKEELEDISIEDLLARHPKDLDLETINQFIQGKDILITGAGGSIGSEIARQCAQFGAKTLTLVDHSEYNLYQIGESIKDADLRLLNITNRKLLSDLIKEISPQVVIHAAAYKHVPICEHNPDIAVQNNILGTKNVIDYSIEHHVEKIVIISTDKAVRPTNIMGATKRVTELYAQNVESKNTEIMAVRFGNVLGSSGSVIPKFKEQIEKGGPVTVTHPEITRYFMLIPEACQLVLQTAAIAKGGELFILDMGEPVKIVDLAKKMIELSGRNDIEIVFTGLRPGEKLYEELLIDESDLETEYDSIMVSKPTFYPIDKLNQDIKMLLACKDKIKKLKEIVPEFNHQLNNI